MITGVSQGLNHDLLYLGEKLLGNSTVWTSSARRGERGETGARPRRQNSTFMTVSNIGMRTNLMNPIWAVGLVTLSLSMKGATGRPSDFSLSLWKAQRRKYCPFTQSTDFLTLTTLDSWILGGQSECFRRGLPAWSTPPIDSPPMARLPQSASPRWKYHSTWSKPSSAENKNAHTDNENTDSGQRGLFTVTMTHTGLSYSIHCISVTAFPITLIWSIWLVLITAQTTDKGPLVGMHTVQ